MSQPGSEPDDEVLLRRFYHGEEAAFTLLMARWRPRLARTYSRLTFNREEVEDLIQELAVKLYLTRERLAIDVNRSVAPYILTMARNLAARAIVRRRGHEALQRYLIEPQDDNQPPQGLLEDLLDAFKELPELEQSYLLLCKQHGLGELSHSEIAATLGKSPQYITHVSQRSLARLRKDLARRGYRIEPNKPPARSSTGKP